MESYSITNTYLKMAQTAVVTLISTIAFCQPTNADSQTDCITISKEVKIASSSATASTWANLRNAEGSLRYETSKLLGSAITKASHAIAPEGVCPDECKAKPRQIIIFTATPRKTLRNYSDEVECTKLLERTTKTPLEYNNKFENDKALSSWFNDFSQGRGKDGKDLYNKCYGTCSPRYHSSIKVTDNTLLSDTSVICGHARDKSDDMFDLEIRYQWQCETSS